LTVAGSDYPCAGCIVRFEGRQKGIVTVTETAGIGIEVGFKKRSSTAAGNAADINRYVCRIISSAPLFFAKAEMGSNPISAAKNDVASLPSAACVRPATAQNTKHRLPPCFVF